MVATQKTFKLKGTTSFRGVLQWLQHAGTLYTYNGVNVSLAMLYIITVQSTQSLRTQEQSYRGQAEGEA